MSRMPNDNEVFLRTVVAESDAYGKAALMLAECTLHTLIEVGAITVRDAIDVVETAAELNQELLEVSPETRATREKTLALLKAVSISLKTDLPLAAATGM